MGMRIGLGQRESGVGTGKSVGKGWEERATAMSLVEMSKTH